MEFDWIRRLCGNGGGSWSVPRRGGLTPHQITAVAYFVRGKQGGREGVLNFAFFLFAFMALSAIGRTVYALLGANFAQFFEVRGFEKPTCAFVCL